jgi:hypothetical protein
MIKTKNLHLDSDLVLENAVQNLAMLVDLNQMNDNYQTIQVVEIVENSNLDP